MNNQYRNGLQRFHERYPDYIVTSNTSEEEVLGIGAMVIPPTRQSGIGIDIDMFGNKRIHNGLPNPAYQHLKQ